MTAISRILRSDRPGPRRGVALLAVMIVVTIGALVGTTLLYAAEAGRESAAASLRTEQSRLLAWSGVQAAMAELASQRDTLLRGGTPTVSGSWVFGGDESPESAGTGPRSAYRLRVIGESELLSETGKLDVNHVPAEVLAKLPGVGEDLAAKIVAARPFASVHDLLGVEGVTEAMLFGEGEAGGRTGSVEEFADADAMGPGAGGGLARLVTVFSFDPNVQAGLGEGGADAAGERRLNLNVEWSEELGAAVERRLGEAAATGLKKLMGDGAKFKRDGDIVRQLQALGVPREEWGAILDVFSTTDAEYLLGRVDLMTAGEEVLSCVPGIDADAAAAIVARRERLEDDARAGPAWLVVDGILTPEQFIEAIDHLTVRAMQWRIVVEAGTVVDGPEAGAEPDGLPRIGGPAEGGGDLPGDSPGALPETAGLADAVVLEAVIDVSSRRPRVAYLRDITMLPLAALVRERTRPEGSEPPPPERTGPDATPPIPDGVDEAPPLAPGPGPTSPMMDPEPEPDEASPPVPPGAGNEESPASGAADGRIGRWTTRSGGGR